MKVARLRDSEGDWAEFCILCSREEVKILFTGLEGDLAPSPSTGPMLPNPIAKMQDEMRKELPDDAR